MADVAYWPPCEDCGASSDISYTECQVVDGIGSECSITYHCVDCSEARNVAQGIPPWTWEQRVDLAALRFDRRSLSFCAGLLN